MTRTGVDEGSGKGVKGGEKVEGSAGVAVETTVCASLPPKTGLCVGGRPEAEAQPASKRKNNKYAFFIQIHPGLANINSPGGYKNPKA